MPLRITPANIETNVRKWLDDQSFSVASIQEQDTYFTLKISFQNNGRVVYLRRTKADGKVLWLSAKINMDDQEQALMKSASQTQKDALSLRLQDRISQEQLIFSGAKEPFDNIFLQKRLGIGQSLDEYRFLDAVNQMDFGIILVIDTLSEESKKWPCNRGNSTSSSKN